MRRREFLKILGLLAVAPKLAIDTLAGGYRASVNAAHGILSGHLTEKLWAQRTYDYAIKSTYFSQFQKLPKGIIKAWKKEEEFITGVSGIENER